jgi:hypothetical protein
MSLQRLLSGTRVVETGNYLSAAIQHFCFDRLAQDRTLICHHLNPVRMPSWHVMPTQ